MNPAWLEYPRAPEAVQSLAEPPAPRLAQCWCTRGLPQRRDGTGREFPRRKAQPDPARCDGSQFSREAGTARETGFAGLASPARDLAAVRPGGRAPGRPAPLVAPDAGTTACP